MSHEPLELEPAAGFAPREDRRPRLEEPLPVRLVAVADVRAWSPPGLDAAHDALYVRILEFVRDSAVLCYRADNFRLWLDIAAPSEDYRPIGIEVPSLGQTENRLAEAKIQYTRQKSLTPGHESLVLQDPAGNWLEINEYRRVG